MSGAKTMALLGAALGLLTLATGIRAAEIHGNAQVIGGTVDNDGEETDVVQQDYRVTFFQRYSPWLSVNLNYRYSRDRTSANAVAERSQSVPEVFVLYSRPKFTARLDYFEQRNQGTSPSSNFDVTSALAYLSYRPNKGPTYVLQYRDESNVADVGLFGRDTDSTLLQFDAVYDRDDWGMRFSHLGSDIDNRISGFQLDQTRNQLRADYQHRWRDGRYTLAAETWISQVDQSQLVPTGASLAQPIMSFDGLFEIDLTPSFGTLSSTPELVDGNVIDPVVPAIEVGGAQTGRNLGVDLGVTQPVTRLEVSVDSISDPGLQWEAYHSPDNFNWTPVVSVNTSYDDALNRYTLRFPEVVDRYFKAVNVSVNALPDVSVTEMRALIDVDVLGRSATESNTYRVDLLAGMQPHDLVRGRVQLYLSNDEDIASGRVSQEVDQLVLGTNWTVDLGHDLKANLDLRYSEYEQDVSTVLRRDVKHYGSNLTWKPLETVVALFEVSRHDESDDNLGIRSTEQARAVLSAEIYPSLSLRSEVSKSTVTDDAGGFFQTVVRWIETVESEPTRGWRIGGSTTLSWFDSEGIQTVSRRLGLELFTTWQIVPYLTFSGLVGYSDDDFTENLHQRHTLSWAPGRKLAASIYFQDSDAVDTRKVTTGGASVSYRLNRKLLLFANASRSETKDFGVLTTEVTNVRLGLRATF